MLIFTGRLAEDAELVRQRKIERARLKAQRFASARNRNSDIREKLKADLPQLAVDDQLQRLIDDQEYSVEFYPTCLAGATTHAPHANVVVIQEVAGHKNLKTTMGYVHTADDRLHQAVANLPTIGTLGKDRADR